MIDSMCYVDNMDEMTPYKIIPFGTKFGELTISGNPIIVKYKPTKYPCKCNCGKETIKIGAQLTFGNAVSCGCLRIKKLRKFCFKHGGYKTNLYRKWCGMKQRCYNKKAQRYHQYGKRGIKVCRFFLNFKNFKNWSEKNGYKRGLSIDRIDNNKGYSPSNCRWATRKTQDRNKRNNRMLTLGSKTLCTADWCDRTGLKHNIITKRLIRGWTHERALTTPV